MANLGLYAISTVRQTLPQNKCYPNVVKYFIKKKKKKLKNAVLKSHWPSKSNPLGFLSPFADTQVEKYVVGPRNIATV